jgi:DnaJ-class molecular chaperone
MPRLGSRGRGDLWVRAGIRIPKKPSRKARRLFEELRELGEE